MSTQFKVGDRVRIVNYGHLIWSWEEMKLPLFAQSGDGVYWYDLGSEDVGKVGVIVKATKTQEIDQYAIEGEPNKKAWYTNNQLEYDS